MNEKNFSLLCALYAAAWHDSCDGGLIIRDPLSRRMLTEEEYTEITRQLIDSVLDEGKAEKIRTTNADRLRTAMYRENGLLSFYMPRRRFFTKN